MATDVSPEQAAADLARAGLAAGRISRQSRWMVHYTAVFATGFGVLTLVLGLVGPLWLRMTISGVLWAGLVSGMLMWARRRPATSRGVGRRVTWGWIGTGVLYGAALFAGTPGQLGNVAYWVPAAIVVTLPLAAASWRESRR